MRRTLSVAFLLTCLAPASAGVPAPTAGANLHGLGWLPSDAYDTGEGLPDPTVNAIAALPNGHVWLGTMRGLARLNGARVVAEPGPGGVLGKPILGLAGTADGDLLASVDAAGVYRLHDGQWQSLGSPFGSNRTQRLRAFGKPGAVRVFATGNGVAEWNGARWEPRALPAPLAGREVFDIALQPASDGIAETLWVASFGGGLYRCIGKAACERVAIDGSGPRTDEIRTLQLQLRAGKPDALWLALQGGGVARLADGGWTRWHAGNSTLPSDFVSDLALVEVPGAGLDVWAGTRSGLAILRDGREWIGADPRIPQLRERVRTLALTRTSQGVPVMWAGSDTGAVRTPLAGPWRLVSRLGSSGNGIWDVWVEPATDGGERVWLASDGEGLARFEDGHWRRYGRADGMPSDSARSIRRVPDGSREGSLWIGTWGGHVARLQGERFVELPTPWKKLPGDAASLLLADRDDVWVGTREQGMAHWDGRQWTWFPPGRDMPGWVYAAVRVGDTLWFSSAGKGLVRRRGGEWRFFGKDIGLPADRFYDLRLIPDADGRPVLWMGSSSNGLVRVDVGNQDKPRLVTDPALPALPIAKAYGAVRDGRGDIMVCTDYGVFSWRPAGERYLATAYHREDGVPHDECNGKALQVDERGRVWIGTVGGAAVYTPPEATPRRPSPLELTGLRVDGRQVRVVDGVLALPRADSALELHYDLLTGEKEAGSRYRVSLLGREGGIGTWEPLDSHAFARLPAGRQRVRIEARDFAGVPAEPLELVVDVPQVWWQTPLARALQVLGALALFWGVLKLRERQLRLRELQLRDMVRDRTNQLQASDTELRRANDELRRLSYTDPLTGLGNRRRLFEALELHCRHGHEQQRPLGLLLMDLDHFKAINDSHGHTAGDLCLQSVARVMLATLPGGAIAARYGGEEFCVVLPGLDLAAATAVAEDLRAAVQAIPPLDCQANGPRVTASIGAVSRVPNGPACADLLLTLADGALYRAKAAGRNRVQPAMP
ncbi:diguanylate cyclase [Thermomonas sp.]|uniref:ligand-binding sensor domain-containing diguanylate cyclase n=1 Tax=Thermomonas sp. TaxID=1971895 RepID=UPI0035AFA4C4